MTLPRGMSSGRGNSRLSSAIGKAPATPKTRAPLKRKQPDGGPTIDPADVSYSTLKRKPLTIHRGPRKPRPGGAKAAHDWRQACLLRNANEHDGYPVDEVTGEPLEPGWQCHHVLEVSQLNAAGFGGSEFIIWNVDNGMCVNKPTHEGHHGWSARIPATALRDWHWDFARMLDGTQGTEAFTARLVQDYPGTKT